MNISPFLNFRIYFMSMLGMSFLSQINRSKKMYSPSEILFKLRNDVIRELKQEGRDDETRDGMDMALIKLDLDTLKLEYAGAYNPLYIINPERKEEVPGAISFKDCEFGWEIKATKRPIGIAPGRPVIEYENHELQLVKGDFLCLFTDGYADQFGGENDSKYGYRQFKTLLTSFYDAPCTKQKEKMSTELTKWMKNHPQTDDICVVGIKI